MTRRFIVFLTLCLSAGAAPQPPLLFEATGAGGFLARGSNHSLRFTAAGIDFSAQGSPLMRLAFAGARVVTPVAEGAVAAETHYYIGDRSQWRTGIPNYKRIRYAGLYPGIDLVAYGSEGAFEYDLEIAPHADVSRIRMRIQGTRDIHLNSDGDLELGNAGFRLRRPVAHQEGRTVDASFRVGQDGTTRFALGAFDASKPLVIDPVITFSTFLGGMAADQGSDVTVDKDGNVIVVGYTTSENFPGPVVFGRFPALRQYAFVAKYAPMVGGKSQLLFTMLLGSPELAASVAEAVTTDSAGNIILAGFTSASQFPVQNPFQPALSVDECAIRDSGNTSRCPDAFLMKIAPDGRSLLFSTYYGGKDLNTFEKVPWTPPGTSMPWGL